MKLVAIMGSPHGMKGNTGRLLVSLLQAAEEAGAETTIFCLGELDLAPCRGCDACHRTGLCAIRDDFERVQQALLEAEAIVLASPNYIFSITAQMKALFDRCCGPIHIMAFQGKHAAAVVSSGGGGCEEVEEYMLRFLRRTGCWTVGSTGAAASQLADPQLEAEALQKAAQLGTRLVEAARKGERFPDQEAALAESAGYMRALVTSRKEQWKYEYEIWQSRGEASG